MATPQIVYGSIESQILTPAYIAIQSDIVIPAGENPTTSNYFNYSVGDPAADEFRLEFFLSESDAQNGVNLLNVDEFLSYALRPETPLYHPPAKRGRTGYLTLTRLDTIPYDEICVKLSICQEGQEITEISTTPIGAVAAQTQQRQNVFSNWRRR